jgi:hypothetical protein
MPATYFIAQSFRLEGRRLVADHPQKMRSADSELATAQRMARTKSGSVAYSITGGIEADVMDDPIILLRAGVLPSELRDGAE